MTPNPFIELANNPVPTLTAIGYAALMLTVTLGGANYALREGATLAALASRSHRQGTGQYPEWWGDYAGGWIPPAAWVLRAGKVGVVVTLVMWALASVVWIAQGGLA